MMIECAQATPRAFAILFKELGRWDPMSFHKIQWYWPNKHMATIRSILRVRREKIDRSRVAFSHLTPITIHFDGSIEPRKVEVGREYKMDLFYAEAGDVIVSKIDLKNGAVGIIPRSLMNVAVTNHFAAYEPDTSKLVPAYFHLLIQAPFFKEYLWKNKVGAEGRKEVKLDFFESILIPIPPLETQ